MKRVGMLVVSLRVVNFGFWAHLGCAGQNATMFCLGLRAKKYIDDITRWRERAQRTIRITGNLELLLNAGVEKLLFSMKTSVDKYTCVYFGKLRP